VGRGFVPTCALWRFFRVCDMMSMDFPLVLPVFVVDGFYADR